MGNDSHIRSKHKQRSLIHKKHAPFPGVRLNLREVKVESGSIKVLDRQVLSLPQGGKTVYQTDPLWSAYDEACARLRNTDANKSSASLAGRNSIEDRFVIAYKKLMRAGKIYKIKGKYTAR